MNIDPEAFADMVVTTIKLALVQPKATIDELEARIKQLEKRPLLRYAGVFRQGETYAEGHLATHAGGLWLATEPTTFTPGTAGGGWRLIVKRGSA